MRILRMGRGWLCALLLAAAAASASGAAPARVVLPTGVAPVEYRLDFEPTTDAENFSGIVEIDVQVARPTRRFSLNSAELTISEARMVDLGRDAKIVPDAAAETVAFEFGASLPAGQHTLRIVYRGHVNESTSGLFRVRYDGPDGPTQALFTQFEPVDARRFMPCWDEPSIKAVFRLGATIPAGLTPVSNMPVASTEDRPEGRRHVQFAPTPPIPTFDCQQ